MDHQNITANRSVTLKERCGLGLCWQQNRAHGSMFFFIFFDKSMNLNICFTSYLLDQRSTYTSGLREFRVIDMFWVGFVFWQGCWSVLCWMNMHLAKEQEIAFWFLRRCSLCQHHPHQHFRWFVEKYSFTSTGCCRGGGIEGWWGVGGSCFCIWAELQGCCISLHLL